MGLLVYDIDRCAVADAQRKRGRGCIISFTSMTVKRSTARLQSCLWTKHLCLCANEKVQNGRIAIKATLDAGLVYCNGFIPVCIFGTEKLKIYDLEEGMEVKTVAVIGALDTKGKENEYLIKQIEKAGMKTLMIDIGVFGSPHFMPAVSASEVAAEMGADLENLRKSKDRRSETLELMANGAKKIVARLEKEGKIDGAVAMGGGQGTYSGSIVMGGLPIGFPKVLISTTAFADNQTKPFEGINDTFVMNSLVDISGLNSVLKMIIQKAAGCIAGLVGFAYEKEAEKKPTIGMTMFGVTTPCVSKVQEILEKAGFEVLVFHATGVGGSLMEQFIKDGYIDGVADVTLAEVTHEYIEGASGPGRPDRLMVAGEYAIPQVIVPGALDLVNFMPPSSVPKKYEGRQFHLHNENLKVMRINKQESEELARIIAKRLNGSKGKIVVLLPLKGLSVNDAPDGDFYDPKVDAALFSELKKNLRDDIPVMEFDYNINDGAFAQKIADSIIGFFGECPNKDL